jgi:cell division protein FtsL
LGGLEETVNVFRRQTALLALAFVIISDFEEEKHVESKATKKDEQVQQPIEVEQLVAFLVISVEARLLDIEANFLDIPVAIPTQSQSKYMMKHKGKKQVEEGNSPTKVT